MKSCPRIYALFLTIIFCTSCKGQVKTNLPKDNSKPENTGTITLAGPNRVTRNIIQDRNGDLWIAAFDGVFRYDGKTFTKITGKVSSARFFSILEDRKGNLWFGSIGSGVYCYDGKSFRHFTTRDGLLNNDVLSIYEDKTGNIWFGTYGGASCYNGKSFRNYIVNGDAMNEDRTGKTFSYQPLYGVNAIIEDKAGKFWFATNGDTFVYNEKTFAVRTHAGRPFKNVRSILEDKKGNIWLGGKDGLWRYDDGGFTEITSNFTGYIYQDKKGNIWTSSEGGNRRAWSLPTQDAGDLSDRTWALYRYDAKFLTDKEPAVKEIISQAGMICGIIEANDGSIWFGASDGVHRYDGNTITDFKGTGLTK